MTTNEKLEEIITLNSGPDAKHWFYVAKEAYNLAIEDCIKNVKIDELESTEFGEFTILNQQVDIVPDLDHNRCYIVSKESLEKLKIK